MLFWLGLIGLPLQWLVWWRLRRLVHGTSLLAAWNWSIPAAFAWSTTVCLASSTSGLLDQFAALSAVLLLCPFIGVLGARRPGVHAWGGFVLLPMIVVLEWPAISALLAGSFSDRLQIPIPQMLGFGLVSVMGLGNYFGTRYTLPVLMLGGVLCLLGWPLSRPETERVPEVQTCVSAASLLLTAASGLLLTTMSNSRQPATLDSEPALTEPATDCAADDESLVGLNRLWTDFRELFGIVWARRVMDRLNQFAEREHWDVRVELTGFRKIEPSERFCPAEQRDERIRWVMKRFVDPEWVSQRLDAR